MFGRFLQVSRLNLRHSSTQTGSEGLKKTSAISKEMVGKVSELGKNLTGKAVKIGKSAALRGMELAGTAGSRLVSSVGGLQEPTIYYFQVFREVAKQVYLKEKMSPPSLSEVLSTWEGIYKSLNKENLLKLKALSKDRRAVLRYGIYGTELYGIFCLGEMLGRRHIVGYKDY